MSSLPWEEKEKLGLIDAFYLNFKECIWQPHQYSEKILLNSGFRQPIYYALIIFTITIALDLLLIRLFFHENLVKQFIVLQQQQPAFAVIADVTQLYFLVLIMFPVSGLLLLFMISGLSHFTFKALVNSTVPYEAFFRIFAYAMTVYIFWAIPFIGHYIAYPWFVFLVMIGLKANFQITPGKSFVVILLPYIIMFLFLAVLIT